MSENRNLIAGLLSVISEEFERKDDSLVENVDPYIPDNVIDFGLFKNFDGIETADIRIRVQDLKKFLKSKGFTHKEFPWCVTESQTFLKELIQFLQDDPER